MFSTQTNKGLKAVNYSKKSQGPVVSLLNSESEGRGAQSEAMGYLPLTALTPTHTQ